MSSKYGGFDKSNMIMVMNKTNMIMVMNKFRLYNFISNNLGGT